MLDIVATNMNANLIKAGVTAPVSSRDGVESDHKTVYTKFKMPWVPSYKINSYTYVRKK